MLDSVVNIRKFTDWYFSLDGREPSKSQLDSVREMCRIGSIPGAFKIGKKWFIDIDKVAELAR